jgi:hypothetical protein
MNDEFHKAMYYGIWGCIVGLLLSAMMAMVMSAFLPSCGT